MPADMPDKIRVDFQEITFRELGTALEAAGVPDLTKASASEQARANAAFAWVVLRRDRPDVTLDDVLDLPVSAVEVVGADPAGNVHSATDGETPAQSAALGASDL